MLLEVCIDDESGARRALAAGADRLEVCSRLEVGGLTPGDDLARFCRDTTAIPLMAMIRPRAGDFVVSASELAAMRADIERVKRRDVDGVVFGALTRDQEVDRTTVRELVALARPLQVTFHRAFDEVRDPLAALEALIELGIERVLTSGCAPDAWAGRETLWQLVESARGRIIVLPGGGVRAHNALALVAATGVAELHSSIPFDLHAAGLR